MVYAADLRSVGLTPYGGSNPSSGTANRTAVWSPVHRVAWNDPNPVGAELVRAASVVAIVAVIWGTRAGWPASET